MRINSLGTQPVPSWVSRIHEGMTDSSKKATDPSAKVEQGSGQELKKDMELNKIINKLRTRDREVRQHEMAHKVAAGPYAGSVVYSYQKGPRGRMYAVGGKVKIDTSEVPDDPEKTMEKARQVERAALAPAQPSGQDLQVAARARQMQLNARMELTKDNEFTRTRARNSYENQMEQYRVV